AGGPSASGQPGLVAGRVTGFVIWSAGLGGGAGPGLRGIPGLAGLAGRAGQLADDPDHLPRVERLGQVGVHADLAAAVLVVLLRPRGDQDDADPAGLRVAAQLP